ncbi:hypothetical protein CSC17_0697 [Klebsiella oxytoca]|nr:hypothetical protein CSC17_0697 [Klebsiella oxytoca]
MNKSLQISATRMINTLIIHHKAGCSRSRRTLRSLQATAEAASGQGCAAMVPG